MRGASGQSSPPPLVSTSSKPDAVARITSERDNPTAGRQTLGAVEASVVSLLQSSSFQRPLFTSPCNLLSTRDLPNEEGLVRK